MAGRQGKARMLPFPPDPRWREPGFLARRALRLPTVSAAAHAARLTPERLAEIGARVAQASAGAPRATFILAPTPRSGTNLVEQLLAAHPATAASPLGLREAAVLAEGGRLAAFAGALARRHPSGASICAEEWLGLALAGALHRTGREAPHARLVVFKDPDLRGAWRLPAVLPGAVPVIVLRDGPRTLDSHVRSWPSRGFGRWLGRSFADRCLEWALGAEAALDLAARADGAVVVRFEAAARDPAGTARRLWAALGLPPDEAAARRAAEIPVLGSSTHSKGAEGVDWLPRARSADFDPAGREVVWSRRMEGAFARIAGPAQARMDREAPVAPPPAVEAA